MEPRNMSILNSILADYELEQLAEELNHYEQILTEFKQQLNEADSPMGFADQYQDEWALFDEAGRRLQVAKKALGLANKLRNPEERAHHKKIVIGLLNKLRALVNRLTRQLTQKVEQD